MIPRQFIISIHSGFALPDLTGVTGGGEDNDPLSWALTLVYPVPVFVGEIESIEISNKSYHKREYQLWSPCTRYVHDKTAHLQPIEHAQCVNNRGSNGAECCPESAIESALVFAVQGRAASVGNDRMSCTNMIHMPSQPNSQLNHFISLVGTGNSGTMIHDAFSGKKFSSVYLSNWILDSGASHHVCNNINKLKNVRNAGANEVVVIPDGTCLKVEKIGDVEISKSLKLENVLYVPDLKCNLISVKK